jgi:hypothetical protein
MFQYTFFLVNLLRTVPLAVLVPGLETHWLTRFGHLLNW